MKPEYRPFVDELIELCIKEDIGDGDHTSLSCIPAGEHGRMRLLCKQEGIIAGIEIARLVLERLDPTVEFDQRIADGTRVRPGDVAFYVAGSLRSLLQAERSCSTSWQRMSGRSHADGGLRGAARRAAHQGARHPQDDARHARAGQNGRQTGRAARTTAWVSST